MPENILGITFTRRAAEEMRNRLSKLLGEASDKINLHTFHSLCFSVLRENLDREIRVMSDEEKALTMDEEALSFDDLITLTLELLKKIRSFFAGIVKNSGMYP